MAGQARRLRAQRKAAQEVDARLAQALRTHRKTSDLKNHNVIGLNQQPKEASMPDTDTKERSRSRKPITCTAEDIVRERDERGLSWAQVARNLDLGSPGQARKAYTVLTGRPHTDSIMQGHRAPRGSGVRSTKTFAVQWDDDSDQDAIIERLQGAWIEESGDPGSKSYTPGHWSGSYITVQRKYGIEEVRIRRVIGFTFGPKEDKPLTVEVKSDQGAYRAFYVQDIKEVR